MLHQYDDLPDGCFKGRATNVPKMTFANKDEYGERAIRFFSQKWESGTVGVNSKPNPNSIHITRIISTTYMQKILYLECKVLSDVIAHNYR